MLHCHMIALTSFSGMQTQVQEATLQPLLAGKDCLAKAKTGGGKTLAFLVPTIERLAALSRSEGAGQGKQLWIGALVVSPARELALQVGMVDFGGGEGEERGLGCM